jgi:hypothetical protein
MSKERYIQTIDEVFSQYTKLANSLEEPNYDYHIDDPSQNVTRLMTRQELINKCKTDKEFSEKWGLKIEERKLSLQERSFLANSNHYEVSQNIKMFVRVDSDHTLHEYLDDEDIPTKQITLTYQNEKIEVYE